MLREILSLFRALFGVITYGSNNISIFEPTDYDGNDGFVCSGAYDPEIDEDNDGYSNAEEIDNGSNPCSASDIPADFDRDMSSDLYDIDDDNDGIIDSEDPYPRDRLNGRSTAITLDYPMLNGDPGTGFYGLGFTGLMSNGSSDYLSLINDDLLIAGGTAGILTIDGVTQSSALGSQNNQENALQFGVAANATSGPFLIHARMPGNVFANPIPEDGRSIGAYIGTGDQDNYLMFAVVATDNGPELTIVHENNAIAEILTPSPNITHLSQLVNLDLFFLVDPELGTVQPQYSIDGGTVTNLGGLISLKGSLLSTLQSTDALAVGIIASATNDEGDFTAQWDLINITPIISSDLGDWSDLAPAQPAPQSCSCHENGYVKAGNKYYLIGGRGTSRSVEIYDPTTKIWTRGAELPEEMHHFQAVELDGLIYVVGAWTGSYPYETNLNSIYIYNPVSNTWSTSPTMPNNRKRGSCGAVAYQGKIYVVAGNDGGHNTDATVVTWFDEFDPATGTWTQLPDAPRGRDHFQVAIVNDKMYVAGGRDSSSPDFFGASIGEVDVYDFSSNTWSTLINNIPTKRSGTMAAAYNGEILIIGGETKQTAAHNEVEALNPQNNTWRSLAPLNQGRHATQAIVDNGAIYIAAGAKTLGATEINANETFFQEIYQVNGALPPSQDELTPGILAAIPSYLDFATVAGSEPQSSNIILSNTGGSQAIIVSSIVATNYTGISVNVSQNFPIIIPPNKSVTFQIDFDPDYNGDIAGDVYIKYNGASESIIIPVNGGSSESRYLYRVNTGGNPLSAIDAEPVVWSGDTSSNPSSFVNLLESNETYINNVPVSAGPSVPSSTPLALFKSERYDSSPAPEMLWDFPVANGDYEVRLYFAETYSGTSLPGQRVFDVAIEDIIVLDDYDVVADAGAMYVGVMQSFEVQVNDEALTIDFTHVIQNPTIKGIEIIDRNDGVGGPTNNAPTISSITDQANTVFDVVNLQVVATDSDLGDTLSYSATGLPSGLSIAPSSGLITGTISGDAADTSPYVVSVTVTDDGEPQQNASTSFYWNVEAINQENQVLYRVNAGGNTLTSIDTEPASWSSDTSSSPSSFVNSSGTNNTYSVSSAITLDPSVPSEVPLALFQSERYDSSPAPEMQWDFPVANGDYEVRLYFAETYSGTSLPGQRIFDVAIEDTIVLDDYDVVADAGAMYVGVMQSFEVQVNDESLTIDFTHVIQNPTIKGIEIIERNDGVGGPTNNAPTISSITDQANTVFDVVNLQVVATDSDLGDALSYSATGLPSGLSIAPSSGLITGTISGDAADTSPYVVSVTVTDDGEPQESATVSLNWVVSATPPINSDPIIVSIDDQESNVSDIISLQVIASDINITDTLSYTLVGQPPGLSISPSGLISGMISNTTNTNIPYQVSVTVTDDGNPQGSASDSFVWTVNAGSNVNNSPVIAEINDQNDQAEDIISLQVFASDSDLGDTLSYSATGLPSGLSIAPSSGLITGTISGDAADTSPYVVSVTVTDDGEPQQNASTSFYWNVEAINQENQVLYRVNAGGNTLTSIDTEPANWSSDTSSSPSSFVNSSGTNNTYSVSSAITLDPSVPSEVPLALFQSERYDSSPAPEMQWDFPVANGDYEVRLYFAETYSGTSLPGQRVFDVAIEDTIVLDDYDVVADAGAMYVGVMQSFEVQVNDESLTIDFTHVIQNPAIKGIEIIKQQDSSANIAISATQFSDDVMEVFSIDSLGITNSYSFSNSNDAESNEHDDNLLQESNSYSGYFSDTKSITGNFQLLANIKTLVSNGERPEVGLIIEEGSSNNTRFVQLGIQLDQNYYARALTDVNGNVEEFHINTTSELPNTWMLLERSADQVSIAVSIDDVDYQLLKIVTIPGLSETLGAGLYIDSGSENIEAEAIIENLKLIEQP